MCLYRSSDNVHVVVFCNGKEKQHLQGKGKEKKNVCNEK
jgi:hypothetical protein